MNPRIEAFVPLSQANTHRIRTAVNLPFGVSERVGLNTRLTEMMLQIGGFRQLKITGVRSEVSQLVPEVESIDASGSALAGFSQVKTAWVEDSDIVRSDDNAVRKAARWNDLNVKLNLAEIENKIRVSDKSVKDVGAWAGELNEAVTKSVVQAGVKNLLRLDGGDTVFTMVWYSLNAFYAARWGSSGVFGFGEAEPATPEAFIFEFIESALFWTIYDSVIYGTERVGRGRRLTLFIGPEVDRAIVLGFMGSMFQLVDKVKGNRDASIRENSGRLKP